ncbi:MAG TPA: hypothetical protein VHQ47_03535 [Phycisphaerae bacterium]|nr:hypothetical protein [Phycisphaerae bacterium]
MRRSSPVRPLDQLEARTLFSMTLYSPFDAFSALAADNAGNVYATVGSAIQKFHKNTDGSLSTSLVIDTVDDAPGSIVYDGANNKLFFTDINGIASVNTDGSDLTSYTITDPVSGRFESVASMTVATDGSVWFGTLADSVDTGSSFVSTAIVGRITADGTLQSTDTPSTTQAPGYMAAAADGSVWITNNGDNDGSTFNDSSISHVTATADGTFSFTEYSVPHPQDPIGGIAVANDGSVWILNEGGIPNTNLPATDLDSLIHITVGSDGTTTSSEVVVPKDAGEGNTAPGPLTIDSSGNLWFSEFDFDQQGNLIGGKLSNYNTTTGVFDRELLPNGEIPLSNPVAVVNGPSGPTDVWAGAYDPSTFEGNLVDDVLPQATASFSVNGRAIAGTEDVALAATVPGVSTLAVGTFSGPAGNYTVSIAWSDGTTSAGQIVTGTDGQQYIALADGTTKTFATQGQYTATISVSDGATTQTAESTISVAPAIVASQGTTVTPLFGRLVLAVTSTFTSAVSEPASAFKVTIAWGDGTTSTGLVVRNPLNSAQYFVLGFHNYRSSGDYTITTSILNSSLDETAVGTAFIHV